jgi:DNA repair protein RadC
MAGKTVLQMAEELLELPGTGGLAGLLAASYQDLRAVKGLGPAKRAELMAVLELARRATAQQLRERECSTSPEEVTHYLQLHLAAKPTRCLPCCFWTVRTG